MGSVFFLDFFSSKILVCVVPFNSSDQRQREEKRRRRALVEIERGILCEKHLNYTGSTVAFDSETARAESATIP